MNLIKMRNPLITGVVFIIVGIINVVPLVTYLGYMAVTFCGVCWATESLERRWRRKNPGVTGDSGYCGPC